MLLLRGIHCDVVVLAVLADDLTFVDLVARDDEEVAAVLQVQQRIAGRSAGVAGHQHAVHATGQLAHHRTVLAETVMQHRFAFGRGQQSVAQADQAAAGRKELQVAVPLVLAHVLQDAQTRAEQFHYLAHHRFRHVHRDRLERLHGHAVDFVGDDVRFADLQFETFAAHVLDEHAQVQQTAPADDDAVGLTGFFESHGDVAEHLAIEPVADLAAGDVLAFPAAERAVVRDEEHLQRGFVDWHRRQRFGVRLGAKRIADVDFRKA